MPAEKVTDEVETWELHGEVQQYFHAHTNDPVTILAAMTKWMLDHPDSTVVDMHIRSDWSDEAQDVYYWGVVRWLRI